MLNEIKELFCLLTKTQRKNFLKLQFLVVIMSIAEIVSVVSIGPFMGAVSDFGNLDSNGLLARVYSATKIDDPHYFLFGCGFFLLIMLMISAILSMFTVWRLSIFGASVGADLGSRLYRYYMFQPWLYHAAGNTSELSNKISQETQRITSGIINPLMQMNARLVMALLMASALIAYNPLVALLGLVAFAAVYVILFRVVRRRLHKNGLAVSEAQSERFKLMGEGFGGIKDVLLLGRQKLFVTRFEEESARFAEALGSTQSLSLVPRFAIELLALGSVVCLVMYFLISHQGALAEIFPLLSVYALAGLKLLPAFQQIYGSVSVIRGNLSAFESVREDLQLSSQMEDGLKFHSEANEHLSMIEGFELKDVYFRYPGKNDMALQGLNVSVKKNQVIGFVGSSGSGKSTALDLILGLIKPESGSFLIDGSLLRTELYRHWQNSVGYVPQSIFLADSSLAENIAFGIPHDSIDYEKVGRAASMANLGGLLDELPEGLETRVGERGVQLSGGQRQRIGIARALYHDAEILILDEATSALDGITEKLVMDAIHDFAGKKTIIMIAHRLATVKKCDVIYFLENGRVVDSGSYNELLQKNPIFKRMAEHA